jgi:thioredoxin reductase
LYQKGLPMFDAIVIGGSSAGLSAALVLGRALRHALVLDDGKPCNRFSHASHGFLTRDGVTPAELVGIAREQLQPYETVMLRQTTAERVTTDDGGFVVTLSDGTSERTQAVLLATGLRDTLPDVPGLANFWGRGVYHCPYCDGYEQRGRAVVVYGTQESALHQAMMLSQWTDNLTLCTDGAFVIADEVRAQYRRQGIRIVETPVTGVRGDEAIRGLTLADGSALSCDAMFIRPATSHRTSFAYDLGCAVSETGVVQADMLGRTSVPGVYAAGDIASPLRSVANAVAQGFAAAAGINYDLIHADFG